MVYILVHVHPLSMQVLHHALHTHIQMNIHILLCSRVFRLSFILLVQSVSRYADLYQSSTEFLRHMSQSCRCVNRCVVHRCAFRPPEKIPLSARSELQKDRGSHLKFFKLVRRVCKDSGNVLFLRKKPRWNWKLTLFSQQRFLFLECQTNFDKATRGKG